MSPNPALRHEVVVALNKLSDQYPDVAIDTQVVEMTLAAEVMGHYRSYQVLVALEGHADGAVGTVGNDVTLTPLRRAMDAELERIFQLFALLFPDHDLHSAHDGVRSLNPVVRANAVEFLDNVLEPPQLRQQVLPLVDDQVTAAQRAAAAGAVAGATMTTPAEAVQTLLGSEDSWMRACGLSAVGTLELRELEPELDRALAAADQAERDAARVAKTHLAPTVVEPELGTAEAERWMSGAAGV